MKQRLIIRGQLAAANEIVNKNRLNRYAGAKQKKENTDIVAWECKAQKLQPFKNKIDLDITFYCKNRRKDKDNILSGAIKFILDGLIAAGIIVNDGWKEIGKFNFDFEVDKENPRIEIEMSEIA